MASLLLVSCGGDGTTTETTAGKTTEAVTTASVTTTAITTAPVTTAAVTTVPVTEALLAYDRYDLNSYMTPIWEGNTVYNESVMFVGKDDKAPLLYTPSEIISVRSADLLTEYREGIDYTLEDGKLVLCEGSSIPVMAESEYYPANGSAYGCFASNLGASRPYVRWGEGDTFFKYQVFVTYRHEDSYRGFVPKGQSNQFPKTLEKLKNGEDVTIVYYGDSITEGYNTSGYIGSAPYAERWSEMSANYLGKLFDNSKVTAINTGVAGKDTVWGAQNFQARVLDYDPDLVVIAFGMNDGGVDPLIVAQRLINMAKKAVNAGSEVLLVATMLPNKEAAGFWGNQHGFEAALLKMLADKKLSYPVVQMSSLHASLLETKPYYHMTGNNINHPNDFLARLYAQSIVEAIVGDGE